LAFSKALEESAVELTQDFNTSLSIKICFLEHSGCYGACDFLYQHHREPDNDSPQVI